MNTKFDDSFVENPLCVYIKQEINQDEMEDNRCLYMRDVMLEDNHTSDDKIDPPANDLFKNEVLVCPEIKHEVEETLFVSVVKTEDGLTSEHDVDKSYLLPEKEDPLDIGCSGSSSSNGVSTKIELHKVEQLDIKCEEGVFDDEGVSKAQENIDFTLSTGKCVTQNINKDNCMQDNGIEHIYDNDLQSMSYKETISTVGGGIKREQYNVYVNSSLNNSNCYEHSRLQDDMFHCYDCGDVYVAKSKISNHLCKGARKFYCIVCNESSINEETLKIHSCILNKKNDVMNGDIDKKSQLENFIENNSVNAVINKIIQHKRHNNDCGKYKCKFCKRVFKCKRTLIFHSNIHTEKIIHKCTFCQKSFNQRGTLKRHLNIHTVEKKYKCNFCEKAFKNRGNLRKHLVVHTGEEKFTCNFCQKSVRKSYFKKHISIHTSEKKFTCDLCQKSVRKSYFKKHICIDTSEEKFTCDFCQKSVRKSYFKKHISIHTSEKKFTCDFCQKSFNRNSNLKKHVSIHIGKKNFKCSFCGKFYHHNSELNRHLQIHTGEKKFTCDFCRKSFSRSDYFKIHLAKHSSEKKFTCNICIKSFIQSRDLKRHLSVHTGEKRFTCNVCEKGFSQNGHLKRHLFIHFGEKKFTCHFCERSFYRNSDLKRHISIHTGEKKFSCKFCEKSFSWGSSLKAHLVVHTDKKN